MPVSIVDSEINNGAQYGIGILARFCDGGKTATVERGIAANRSIPDVGRYMNDDNAEDELTSSDLVALVQESITDRDRAEFVEVRDATPRHVDIVLEEWEADGERSHYLYRVTIEPNLDEGTHLHWEALGEVVKDE